MSKTTERIKRANPVSNQAALNAEDSAALFDSILRRRGEMTGTKQIGRTRWYRRPVVVATAAAIAIAAVVIPAALLAPQRNVATSPDHTVVSTTPTTPATTNTTSEQRDPTTSTQPPDVAYNQVIVSGRVARATSFTGDVPGVGSNNLPVILYSYEDAPLGDAAAETGLGLLRCQDPLCLSFESVDIPYADWPPLGLAAFLPDGSPILTGEVEPGGTWGEDNPLVSGISTLYVCSDPSCTQLTETALETDTYLDFIVGSLRIAIGSDGLPVLYVQSDVPPKSPKLREIRCLDRSCSEQEVSTLIEGWYLGPSLATDDKGRLVLARDGDNAVVCEDLACSTGATVVSFESLTGVAPIASNGYADHVAVGTSIRTCYSGDLWCESDVYVDLGMELWQGPASTGRDPSGNLVVLFATPLSQDPESNEYSIPGELWMATCSDTSCSDVEAHPVATLTTQEDFAAGRWVDDAGFSLWTNGQDPPLVVYSSIDGMHLIRCQDWECRPQN